MLSVAKAGKHFVILRNGLTIGRAHTTRRAAEEEITALMSPPLEIDELKSAALMSVLRECVNKQGDRLRSISNWEECC